VELDEEMLKVDRNLYRTHSYNNRMNNDILYSIPDIYFNEFDPTYSSDSFRLAHIETLNKTE